MLFLIFGMVLWWGVYFFKWLVLQVWVDLGKGGWGLIVVVLVVVVLLMIWGYCISDGLYWWGVLVLFKGINNLLVLVVFYLFVVDGMKMCIICYVWYL